MIVKVLQKSLTEACYLSLNAQKVSTTSKDKVKIDVLREEPIRFVYY